MDLGFGGNNQQIGQATANALVRVAEAEEKKAEYELAQYDRLLDDEVSWVERELYMHYTY